MSAPGATPGPLQFVDGDIWDTRADGEPGVPLFRAQWPARRLWGREVTQDELEATGKLFAASPALYDALEAMEHVFGNDTPLGKKARAALALARGEAA